MSKTIRSQSGMSLMMILVGVAISGTMVAVFSTILTNFQRESRSLQQKLDILENSQMLLTTLSDTNLCGCNFDPNKNVASAATLKFNINAIGPNSAMTVSHLYGACDASGTPSSPLVTVNEPLPGNTSGLNVTNISLGNIRSTGSVGQYLGDLSVVFDHSKLIIGRKPAKVTIRFQADTTVSAQSYITACSSTGGAPLGSGGGGGTPPPPPPPNNPCDILPVGFSWMKNAVTICTCEPNPNNSIPGQSYARCESLESS